MTEAPQANAERVLGKYHIVRPLKIGGTAAIYLAIMRGENNFSREVVIKRPLPHLIADPRSRLMFVDEAHIAARLSHPNICQVLDLVARDDEVYLVLEYLRGVDLREILKRCFELNRFVPPEVAVWIAIEVAAGLDFAHEAIGLDGRPLNLVHRDLSPKNIRLTFSGAVKVIDFGIARAINRATETQAGTIKGTLGYMSPEQIMGDEIDRRTDIFAFGICLFQTLTGRNPFDGQTLKERVRRLTQDPIPSVRDFNPSLDEEIAGIVAKCLERDVNERYPRLRDVQHDLDRYLARLGVVSPRQKLINFLEEIFPDHKDIDFGLSSALSEISAITGRIDTEQRVRFPDDPVTEPAKGAATIQSAVPTQPGISPLQSAATRPTIEGEPRGVTTKPVTVNKSEDATRYNDTRITPEAGRPAPPKRWPMVAGAAGFLAAVAIVGWAVMRPPGAETVEPIASPPPPVAPPPVAPPPVAPPPPPTKSVDPGSKVRPAPPPPPEPSPGTDDKDKARLFFRTARRFDKQGKAEEASLLYTLAYVYGGKQPDPAIYLNLGLVANKEHDVPKARACLRGYLERRPDAPEADRVRTLISSFPSTKSVACVDPKEAQAARREYQRRGATIDAWVEDTMKEMLK